MAVTFRFMWLLLAVLSLSAQAGSARMSLTLPTGLVAEADFWPGGTDRQAVLIVHGFLQTRDFPTVRRLAEALADEGYSVLLPSLSLGFDRRQQSVACEAIHTHSMQQDVDELRAWVEWLSERSTMPPVAIGHSAGGVQLSALLESHRQLPIERVVLISLSYFGEEQTQVQRDRLLARANRDLLGNPNGIDAYALTFCQEYVTGPAQLLSYLQWDKTLVEQVLVNTVVPVAVIYGDRDQRIDRNWMQALSEGGVAVHSVAGANHFFDLAHEFDLLDVVLEVIRGGVHG